MMDRSAVSNSVEDERELHGALLRMNARAWGIAVGLLMGGAIFVATNFLVLKGGQNVGRHLRLLAVYFPGYSVTFLGSIVGFIYLFVIGYILGRLIGAVYNRMVQLGR
ncbi:MAG: hypothetical protein H7Z74_04290 [Anaerolineae bacterium]|nr:hypothetical protein [Gemmatimonadaceae bacterium]